jgi:hypothetical protein
MQRVQRVSGPLKSNGAPVSAVDFEALEIVLQSAPFTWICIPISLRGMNGNRGTTRAS